MHFVTLNRYDSPDQARYQQERIENAGIYVDVRDDRARQHAESDPALPLARGAVELRVREEDAKRAGELLEEEAGDAMGNNPAVF